MFEFFVERDRGKKEELLAGLSTGLYLFPEIIAIAFLAGVSPSQALLSASVSCITAGILTGSPGLITGSSRAIALICMLISVNHGAALLFPTVILAGILQVLLGYFKLAKFIRLVPRSVYMGFLNGFSVLLLIYLAKSIYEIIHHPFEEIAIHWYYEGTLFCLGLLLLYVLPKFYKTIPSVLVLFVLGLACGLGFDTSFLSVQDYLQSFDVPLEQFHFKIERLADFGVIEFVEVILPFSILIAFSATVESLMGVMMVDELTHKRGQGNKETIAQGISNITAGFLMGVPAVATIGATAINVRSGGRTKLSSIVAGVTLLITAFFLKELLLALPLVVLLLVNFALFLGLFSWSGIRFFHRIPLRDTIVLILVSGLTILTEYPAVVILLGVVISALGFAWDNAVQIRVFRKEVAEGLIEYEVRGLLFFASFNQFLDKFDLENDTGEIIIDFKEARIVDHSGIDALYQVAQLYLEKSCTLKIRSLSRDSRFLIQHAMVNTHVQLIETPDDPVYKVVTDKVIQKYE